MKFSLSKIIDDEVVVLIKKLGKRYLPNLRR